ncbi:MAG TPA: response regulator [Tepidisphaeraceae bacterium]|nr:response regulator [Tepidisphaeraceae bacterium]
MAPVVNLSKAQTAHQPRVLVVDDEPEMIELVRDLVGKHADCKVYAASTIEQARRILANGPVEVLVADVNLPDGDGTSLVPTLHEKQPHSSAIVITGSPSVDGAVSAFRGGAIDFVAKPFTGQQIVERVRKAIESQAQLAKRERRIDRLRDAVKRLNESRKLISKKVDLLCNDLVSAYGELSKQLDDVRTQEGFRKFIKNAKDLEQLLCHSMDWLLRQVGYSNVAVFLAADDGAFQLGAYMKYTTAGEAALTDAIKRVLVPMAAKDALVRIKGSELAGQMTPKEMGYFKGQDVLAVNCTYLGESLASLIFFRDERAPYSEGDAALLRQISAVFAVELATIVRDTQEGDTAFDDAPDTTTPDADKKTRKPKKDPADWWKNGEAPPF